MFECSLSCLLPACLVKIPSLFDLGIRSMLLKKQPKYTRGIHFVVWFAIRNIQSKLYWVLKNVTSVKSYPAENYWWKFWRNERHIDWNIEIIHIYVYCLETSKYLEDHVNSNKTTLCGKIKHCTNPGFENSHFAFFVNVPNEVSNKLLPHNGTSNHFRHFNFLQLLLISTLNLGHLLQPIKLFCSTC